MEGVDFSKIFSPTSRSDTISVILATAVQRKSKILQIHVKTAFLYDEVEEIILVEPLSGLSCAKDLVCRLKNSLYELKCMVFFSFYGK